MSIISATQLYVRRENRGTIWLIPTARGENLGYRDEGSDKAKTAEERKGKKKA